MREMTNDTRIALEKIRPFAYELGIDVDADGSFLYCNGQAIGIGCNSTYATINEFLGYAFLRMCEREYRFQEGAAYAKELKQAVKRYWFSKAQLEQFIAIGSALTGNGKTLKGNNAVEE